MQPDQKIVVGITGARGLLGWHTATWLQANTPYKIVPADRRTFDNDQALDAFVRRCTDIIHYAGANRGRDEDVAATNIGLARALIDACRRTGSRPHIIFANSIQAGSETAYGRSKAGCAAEFMAWANVEGGQFTDLVLPHVFGEHGRPFYNSVVSTFCFNLANGDQPQVLSDGPLELLHALDVAAEIPCIIGRSRTPPARESPVVRLHGAAMVVTEMLGRLQLLAADYENGIIPDIRDPFDLRLFNTYRSYLYPGKYPRPIHVFSDNRGWLVEAVKERSGGQAFVSSTKPGQVRGNHFHFFKFERFLVVHGDAEIRVRRLGDVHVETFQVNGVAPAFVDMPTLHTHAIMNRGTTDVITLFWSSDIYDPSRPDTYPENV
jgi:UDP-2-acetamido-2,6-beta-L-arabino-hexul-4-ose reductase